MKKRITLPLFCLLVAVMLSACVPTSAETQPANKSSITTGKVPDGDLAKIVNVIDGDTVDVDIRGREYRLRYIGVDTPERGDPFYEEATRANRRMVEGETVILVKDVSDTDQYGRMLRYIYLQDGTFVNATLINEGFGRVVSFPPDVAHLDEFVELQKDARENGRGLWGLNEMQALPIGCDTCGKNVYNCSDFETQPAAQACFDACMDIAGEDIHHLDGGGDGRVCESLPRK